MKAIFWHDETMGADYSVEEIPASCSTKQNSGATRCLRKSPNTTTTS